MKSLPRPHSFFSNLNCSSVASGIFALAALLFALQPAPAANLLVNPSFEQNSGRAIPTGWTYYAPPGGAANQDYWIEGKVPAEAGLLYWKQWAALNTGATNVAGVYQDFGSAPGNTYQASGWIYTDTNDAGGLGMDGLAWFEVSFLGSSSNLLALYKSDNFSAAAGLSTWLQYNVTNVCNLAAPNPGGDPYFTTYAVTGTVSQLVAPAGTQKVRFRLALSQSGIHGSCYFDATVLNQTSGSIPPVITSLYPQNIIFVNPSDGLSFTASSPSGNTIASSSIGVILNGANISSNLTITGSSSNKSVSYHGLQSNTVYTASISVTDSVNFVVNANSYFETMWVGIQPVLYLWEAEDFNFSSNKFYDNPIFCTSAGTTNCYFGSVGVPDVDEFDANGSYPPTALQYRPSDAIGTIIAGDYNRKDHYLAGVFDYRIDPFEGGMWLNFTRDWTNGTYWVVGRLSANDGASGRLSLSAVTSTSTNVLGTFKITTGRGWSVFQTVYLQDTNNNNALVTLSGRQTLRLTNLEGNVLPNFLALVVAVPDLPQLNSLYPSGEHPFEPANTLSFTVTASGSSFPANGIRMFLDGFDVTSNLVITGTTSTKNVVYPTLQPDAIHSVAITITNALGHGISLIYPFDTFSEANFSVEAEDFDYGGGQFIANWSPDAYWDVFMNVPPAVTNIDFNHTTLSGETTPYEYRTVGVPQYKLNELVFQDYRRTNWVDGGLPDFYLGYFGGGDWANYTRNYPTGSFFAYVRTSGQGPFSLYLDQVVSGAGTVNQGTHRLGRFGGVGVNYDTFAWVPLTDDGLAAPTVVKLSGQTTLRLTTAGGCNPNFFMFVPTSGIGLTASRSAGNVILSFHTQAGVAYRVFYRTDLTGNWNLLTNVLGNGATTTVNDPTSATRRYYKVTAP